MKDRKERFLQKARLAATTSHDAILKEVKDHEYKADVLRKQIKEYEEDIKKSIAQKEQRQEELDALQNLVDFKREVVGMITTMGEDKT